MYAKRRLNVFDALAAVIVVIILVLGLGQAPNANYDYIFGLAALALSVLTFYLNLYRPKHLLKPILHFEGNVQPSPPTQHEVKSFGTKPSWFLRLRIVNTGLTPAKKCVGRLIEVSDNSNNRFDRFDPFYLYWSRQNELNEYSPIDIQGNGDFFFLDIAQIAEGDSNDPNPVSLRIVDPGGRLVLDSSVGQGKKLPPGIYHLRIAVYSEEDVFIEPTWFTISCPVDLSAQNPPNIERRDEYLRRKK